jgi:hypothetical protein
MSSSSKSKKTTINNTTAVNTTFDGENNYQLVDSNDNEITFTDYGAVEKAFDSFDNVISSQNLSIEGALSAVTGTTDKTVAALKEFATQLTVGDIEGSKWIALAIIAAVLVALVFFIWRS